MRILYVDESGDTDPLRLGDERSQPLLTVLGLALEQHRVEALTRGWVSLKRRFFPGLCPRHGNVWDWQTAEVKGTDLRRAFRSSDRRERRATVGLLDRMLDLIERHNGRFGARVWIKPPGGPFDGRAVYTSSVQWLCGRFQSSLSSSNDSGIVIADSRNPAPNTNVAHSIFTQKFSAPGDPYPRILEVPVFGHSYNHAGLQLADVLSSGLVTPICAWFFLTGRVQNQHVLSSYEALAERYCPRLQRMQLPAQVGKGGQYSLVVSDPVGLRGHMHLFRQFGHAGVEPAETPAATPDPDDPSPGLQEAIP